MGNRGYESKTFFIIQTTSKERGTKTRWQESCEENKWILVKEIYSPDRQSNVSDKDAPPPSGTDLIKDPIDV